MSRIRSVPLGVINLASNPHSNDGQTYVDLLKHLASLRRIVKVRGDESAILASCVDFVEGQPLQGQTGEIHKFTDIGEDWVNLTKLKPASEEDLQKISIPNDLRPNSERFRYFLYPLQHRVVFQLKGAKRSISPHAVQRLFETLVNDERVKVQFPLVSVTVEQKPESLDAIFSMPFLHRLEIDVKLPNAGDEIEPDEIEQVEKMLREQGARSQKTVLEHAPKSALKPNSHNRKLARVARSYGKVMAWGKNEKNRPVSIDTSQHPVKEPFDYDPKLKESFVDQMYAAGKRLLDRLLS